MRCSNYIDDFIFFAATREEALRVRKVVLADLTRLGWFISASKSMLGPGTFVKYLGLVFCSLPVPHVRVPQDKVRRVEQSFAGVLKQRARGQAVYMRGHTLSSVLGFLQSLRLAVPLVPVFTRELYSCMGTLPKSEEGWFELGESVLLGAVALAECELWAKRIRHWNGFVIPPVKVSRVPLYRAALQSGFTLMRRVLAMGVLCTEF